LSDLVLTIEEIVFGLLEKTLGLDGDGFIEDQRDTIQATANLLMGAVEVLGAVYSATDPTSEGGVLLSTLELQTVYGEADDLPSLLALIAESVAAKKGEVA
jgi:hypothetical protein